MSLIYPNKCKRAGYWPAYEQARINDFLLLFKEICEVIPQIAEPPRGRGRPPHLTLRELYCVCTLAIAFDFTFRELETFVQLLLNKELDHTNLSRWLSRLDENVIDVAIKKLNRRMTRRRRIEYVVDSTPLTLTVYYVNITAGKEVLELMTWKLHVIIAYLSALGLLSIVSVYATHGDAHDSPIFREGLVPQAQFQRDKRIHGDKAYFAEESIVSCEALGIKTNFVPKDNIKHGLILKRAIEEYDNEARKRFRGMIEGLFGGTTTDNGNKTRFVKDKCRKTHIALMALSHEIRTYFRALEHKAQSFLGYC